jgi:hypothetical protein
MKVKVIKADIDNWYKVGEVHEVENRVVQYDGYKMYPLIEDRNVGIDPDDCLVVGDTLPAETFLVGEKCNEHFVTEADKLALRMEMATRMAANIPEKTLRDEFAMSAMNAILPKFGNLSMATHKWFNDDKTFAEQWAENAYQIADAMMEVRNNIKQS